MPSAPKRCKQGRYPPPALAIRQVTKFLKQKESVEALLKQVAYSAVIGVRQVVILPILTLPVITASLPVRDALRRRMRRAEWLSMPKCTITCN